MSVIERPFDEGRKIPASGFHIAVLLASEITRQGLTAMLSSLPIVKEIDAWDQASVTHMPRLCEELDMLILGFDDLDIEKVDQVAREADRRGVKVLLLLHQATEEMLDSIVAIPSHGILVQNELSTGSLNAALTKVAAGDIPMPPALARGLLTRARQGALGPPATTLGLTPREKEVLELLVEGLSNKQIARRLHISQHGVKRLVSNVLAKLGCPNRTHAVAVAISAGILTG